jgi:hypothetical protein
VALAADVKLPIPKMIANIGYGNVVSGVPVADGRGSAVITFIAPMAVAGILRKLRVFKCQSITQDMEISVGPMSVTLTPSDPIGTQKTDTLHSLSVAPGDTPAYSIDNQSFEGFPGKTIGVCLEWESTHQVFSLCGGGNTGSWFGGAFGNGGLQTYGGGGLSVSYSICGVAGNVTHLMVQRYGSPSGGAWTGWIRRNEVTQDGTGGTVDTTCSLPDTGPDTALSRFELPVVPFQDRCDVLLTRTGPSALSNVAASVGFLPDIAGQFMLCGGTNNVISNDDLEWQWNGSEQLAGTIEKNTAPISTAFMASGLTVDRGAPGLGCPSHDSSER